MADTFTLEQLDKPQTLSLDELEKPAEEGLASKIFHTPAYGVRQMVQGGSELLTSGQRKRGAANIIQGGMKAALPFGVAAAIPAAIAAPAATAASIALGTGGSMVGGYGGREAVKAFHGGEDAQQLGEAVGEGFGGLVGGVAGARMFHQPAVSTPASAGPTLSSGSTYREAPPTAGTATYGGGPKGSPPAPSSTVPSSVQLWSSTTHPEIKTAMAQPSPTGKLTSPVDLSKEEIIKGIMKGMRADRATAEALYEKMPKQAATAAKPTARPVVPPPANPEYKLDLGPTHASDLQAAQEAEAARAAERAALTKKITAQNELEQALASTGVKPNEAQIEALQRAKEEFKAGKSLPPQASKPLATPKAEPKPMPATEEKVKTGHPTTEQTNASMAKAIKGTKLESFLKANPGSTMADYIATTKGKEEIQNFLKSTSKPVKGLESPVKNVETGPPKVTATKSEEINLSPKASELKSIYDRLPEHYKQEGITWPQAINQARADAKVIEYLVNNGRAIKDWMAADRSTKSLIRSEAGVASKGDPDGERLLKTWKLAAKK